MRRTLLAIVTVLGMGSVASAQMVWYRGTGDWSTASNWNSAEPTSSDQAQINNWGTALVTQDGEACYNLYLARWSSGGGSIRISGGTLTVSNEANIGYAAKGTVNQSGGTMSSPSITYLGYTTLGTGIYNLSGGTMTTGQEYIAYQGNASFVQSGGEHITPWLALAGSSFGVGSYELSGGQLSVANVEYVGYAGTGTFTQSGGTNTLAGWLSVGEDASANGTYSLSGTGVLSARSEWIGDDGNGTFTQSGGTNTVLETLILGYSAGSQGTYNLTGGTLALKSIAKGLGTAAFNFGGGTLQATGDFSTGVPMTLTGINGNARVDTAGHAVTLAGKLTGDGGLMKLGDGTLTLSGSNTYQGGTSVNGGTLKLAKIAALGSGGLAVEGGTVDLNGFSVTLPTLSGSSGTITDKSVGAGTTTLTVDGSESTQFGGKIQNGTTKTLALAKSGTGTLKLTGANTYTGQTTVNGGTLVVDGSLSSTGATVVENGGTLGGSGVLGSVEVHDGGHLAPGDSLGTLTLVGNLTLSPGALLDFELDALGSSDLISMAATTLSLDGLDLDNFAFTLFSQFGSGTYTLIDAGTIVGTLGTHVATTLGGRTAKLAVAGNDLVLNVGGSEPIAVPEPATWGLLLIGVVGLLGIRRRRIR